VAILIPPRLGAARRRDAPSVGFHRVEEARHPRPSCCGDAPAGRVKPSRVRCRGWSHGSHATSAGPSGPQFPVAATSRRCETAGTWICSGTPARRGAAAPQAPTLWTPPPGCFPGGTCTPRTAATSCLNTLTATASSTAAGAPCGRASPPTRPAAALSGKRRTISWFATTSTPAHVGRADADPRLVVRQGSPVCRSASTRCQALRAAIRTGSHTGENGGA